MTDRPDRRWALAALLWLACVLAVGAHQWQFWRHGALETDVMALLPHDERAPQAAQASRELSERVARQVVVLVGAPDWESARRAALPWREVLATGAGALRPLATPQGADADAMLAFYRPWRDRLLTSAQRAALHDASQQALVDSALALVHQPGLGARLGDWAADPLDLGTGWLLARAGQSKARPRDGELWVAGDGLDWLVLRYEVTGSPFSLSGEAILGPLLGQAQEAARRAVPQARVLAAGVPLHAEAAAVQASREVNTIGWGSLAAVMVLAWAVFRGPRPLLLTALSLGIGIATALSVTAWVFGQVHLLTLVFGASLVGVAEDYGIHYFAARQGRPGAAPRPLMRSLMPGLALALGTSLLAYLALGLAPFPGLRQMALFSATGLAATFLTAVCWFPLLDRGTVKPSALARAVSASLARWPRVAPSRRLWLALGVAGLFCAAGLAQLRASDDLRHWQGSPPAVLNEQAALARLLGLPSVAQFYLVAGASAQQLLEREEALKDRLDAVVARGDLAGYVATSDWLPSIRRQQADGLLTARAESQVLAGVGAALGELLARPVMDAPPLTPEHWLQQPVSAAARGLWLGEKDGQWTSVVMLNGLHQSAALPRLAQAAQGLPGVRWIDRTGEVSSLLGRYRWAMGAMLVAGHLAVFAALWWRYRQGAWRIWLPTLGASLLTVAALGWLGEPLQLSNVLALILLLGIGVDYGIFLAEHDGDGSAWLAVVLGAASTWLAFGLLALSATPALHAFGLTLLLGVALVWFSSPCLRPRVSPLAP